MGASTEPPEAGADQPAGLPPRGERGLNAFDDPLTLPLDDTRPDLVFGLISPIGTDLDSVTDEIKIQLRRFSYEPVSLKLTELMRELEHPRWFQLASDVPRDRKYNSFMDAGNCLREFLDRDDAMALLAVLRMVKMHDEASTARVESRGRDRIPSPDHRGFIVDSLKTPEEVQLLRSLYGGRFLAISVYAPQGKRLARLAQLIAESHNDQKTELWTPDAMRLMLRDQEELRRYGQNVANAFPQADVFIDATDARQVRNELTRAFDLLFDYPYATPSPAEYAMAIAQRASLRSADLARQIGAVITRPPTNAVIAVGVNEVPRRGGGQYWVGDDPDDRDFQRGQDTSRRRRETVLRDTIRTLVEKGWRPQGTTLPKQPGSTSTEKEREDHQNLLHQLVTESADALLRSDDMEDIRLRRRLLVQDIIEFSRTVHAEMAAIIDAALRGVSVEGCSLFTTTFPCHECARHIIAAGIVEVQYIEPYPKSLVEEFHSDSISLDLQSHDGRVWFHPYVGIAPRRFESFFATTRRKGIGTDLRQWDERQAHPRAEVFGIPQGQSDVDRDYRRSEYVSTMFRESRAAAKFDEDFLAGTRKPPTACVEDFVNGPEGQTKPSADSGGDSTKS